MVQLESKVMTIVAMPKGTYGAKMPGGKLLGKVFGAFTGRQIAAYRRTGGKNRMSRMMAFPVVLLTTKGARSGDPRTTPIGGFADGDDAWLVVASNAGAATHPAWFLNMAKNPDDLWLEVGPRKLKVRGESLTGQARLDAIQRVAAISARYGKYQEHPLARCGGPDGSAGDVHEDLASRSRTAGSVTLSAFWPQK